MFLYNSVLFGYAGNDTDISKSCFFWNQLQENLCGLAWFNFCPSIDNNHMARKVGDPTLHNGRD